nr:hypothetical protein [Cohaesibacter haloalkalitolerans]
MSKFRRPCDRNPFRAISNLPQLPQIVEQVNVSSDRGRGTIKGFHKLLYRCNLDFPEMFQQFPLPDLRQHDYP